MKKYITGCLCLVLTFTMAYSAMAEGIKYLPDVRSEMSCADFWTGDEQLLMTSEEIVAQNNLTISTKETYMYDLKNQPEFVNTIELNKALLTSSKADADYYLGWTYLESDKLATESDFDKMIENTQNAHPKKRDEVSYGVAVRRTNLHTFPSDTAIWDDPKDPECNYQYLASVRVNEPLVITSVSNDGKFYLAKSICCSGWVPAEDVSICKDKAEWFSAWDIPNEKSLVVYGDKVYTEMSVTGKETSEVLLTMGTVLEVADIENPNELIDNRAAYQNYVVYMPIRNSDGSYEKKLTLISENEKVHIGYMPMTKNNIVSVAFEALGNTYGWGNWLNSDDCSGYIRNIYKCFGLELARNTTWQSAMPMAKIDIQYMCREERISVLEALPAGSVLYFSGHEMMYLGSENGKYYVVSAVGTVMQPENPSVRQRIRSMVINTLEIKRGNGNTWLDDLTVALIPYWPAESSDLPRYAWYHDGVAFCLKNKLMQGDENKFFNPDNSITWAEFLQVLWNMEGKPDGSGENQVNWYDDAVKWATETKLIYEEDKDFLPDTAITREELVSVLYLYVQYKGIDIGKGKDVSIALFDDASEISEYAVSSIEYATRICIISGRTQNTINPKDNTTRAEIAVILERFSKTTQQ